MNYVAENRASIVYELPLAEMVGDFFDQLKYRTKGYASMEYCVIGYRESDLIRHDILINAEMVEPLSTIVHRDKMVRDFFDQLKSRTKGYASMNTLLLGLTSEPSIHLYRANILPEIEKHDEVSFLFLVLFFFLSFVYTFLILLF